MKRIIATLCCISLCCSGFLNTAIPVFADAEETSISSVTMEISELMSSETIEGELSGEIAVTVYDHPIHVAITYAYSEGVFTFYDVDLAPEDGYDATEYIFPLKYCEMPEDTSHFETTYTADFLTGVYTCAYSITITVPDCGEDITYTESNILISAYHKEEQVTGTTRYQYTVQFSEKQEEPVIATVSDAVITDGSAVLDRQLQMLWEPYTLGDVDDDGVISLTDAYTILLYYAYASVGSTYSGSINLLAADVDKNDVIGLNDAYITLLYYAQHSVGINSTIEELVAANTP